MASADRDRAREPSRDRLINITTGELKEKLNRVYRRKRENSLQKEHFDLLWDIKELALLERRQSVDVPEAWLAEAENPSERHTEQHGH